MGTQNLGSDLTVGNVHDHKLKFGNSAVQIELLLQYLRGVSTLCSPTIAQHNASTHTQHLIYSMHSRVIFLTYQSDQYGSFMTKRKVIKVKTDQNLNDRKFFASLQTVSAKLTK